MKNIRILLTGLFIIGIAGITSCKKDNNTTTDIRDQYVGTWQYQQTGNLTFYQNGQSIGTDPVNNNGSCQISESGDNDLIINSETFHVDGDKLTSDPQSITETENGVNIVGTETDEGQLGSNIITINSNITGTWNNTNGANGNFSGTMTETLTK